PAQAGGAPAHATGAPVSPVGAPPRPAGAPPRTVASPDTVLPSGPAAGAATALSAPTMIAPVVVPGQRPAPAGDTGTTSPEAPADAEEKDAPKAPEEPEEPDPEQVLAQYKWRFHPETLREIVEDPDELRDLRDRLTKKLDKATDNASRARLLSLRAVVSRILGDLNKALADGKLALAHAEATGQLRRIAITQARLAH